MKVFNSVNEILDFAMNEEQAAADFYTGLATRMNRPWMREVFEQFAREEMGHKAKLEKVKCGGHAGLSTERVLDLKIGEYLVEAAPSAEMDYQDALVLAMKKEKAAFRLYSDLAKVADDDNVREVLLGLAQEEAKHKLRFEVEYDDNFMKEN
jgi:rubrerythrin